jgi:hypothetical protein
MSRRPLFAPATAPRRESLAMPAILPGAAVTGNDNANVVE